LYNFMVKHHDVWDDAENMQPVSDDWANDHYRMQGEGARALARGAALARFTQHEHELAFRELGVQQYNSWKTITEPAARMPFRMP
jgi:hypothetical protein